MSTSRRSRKKKTLVDAADDEAVLAALEGGSTHAATDNVAAEADLPKLKHVTTKNRRLNVVDANEATALMRGTPEFAVGNKLNYYEDGFWYENAIYFTTYLSNS